MSEAVTTKDTLKTYRIVMSTRSVKVLVIPDATWQLVEDQRFDQLPSATRQALSDALILVPNHEDELSAVLTRNRQTIAASRTLYECIQPSAACQLGCDYCGQRHHSASLSEQHQDALVDRIRQKICGGDYDELEIGWFGGEPLIGLHVIRRLTERLRKLALGQGCRYRAKIVTNGLTLTASIASELHRDLGVEEIEVTLDGPPDAHDARRMTKGGAPTFSRIFDNLMNIVRDDSLDVRLLLRCNVDRRNAHRISELIDLLSDSGAQRRMTLYFAPIHDWGNDARLLALSPEEFADHEIEWFAHMARRGFIAPLIPRAKPIVCMAVNPHAELLDPHGQLFNCTEVSLVPAYGEPNLYTLGVQGRPRKSAPATALSGFLDEIEQGKHDCGTCRMLPVCGGACPKEWHDGHKPCPSAKQNIQQRLILAWALARSHSESSGVSIEPV